MGWKDSDGLGKYRHETTTNLRAYRRSEIMGMVDNISGEDSGELARWRRCGTTEMDTTAEEMRYGNRRDVGRWRWQNGLEGL